jgi:hypothetical protein
MGSISLKAVLIGGVFDIVASMVLGAVLAVGFIAFEPGGMAAAPAMAAKLIADPRFYLASLFLGGAVSILAGYIAAAIAGRGERLNGALSSFLCVAEGIYGLATQPHGPATLPTIFAILISPVLGLAGGYLRKIRGTKATVGAE